MELGPVAVGGLKRVQVEMPVRVAAYHGHVNDRAATALDGLAERRVDRWVEDHAIARRGVRALRRRQREVEIGHQEHPLRHDVPAVVALDPAGDRLAKAALVGVAGVAVVDLRLERRRGCTRVG